MSNVSENCAKILLKARPTLEQLLDRLEEPMPDGLELYLDVVDIKEADWLETLKRRVSSLSIPPDFHWVVEGPLRSLDGTFFDVSNFTPANIEVVRRLVNFGGVIGAKGAVIHAIAPTNDVTAFSESTAAKTLEHSLRLLQLYAELCEESGLVPTIENIPPVTRMRESRFMHSLIGMEPQDLLFLTSRIEGLRVTIDVSHAQLYLNAANLTDLSIIPDVGSEVAPLITYLSSRREVSTLEEYILRIEHLIFESHFSNARGLLGEGLAYDDGEIDLDRMVVKLGRTARYLVTETIEHDPNKAILMREAQARMNLALRTRIISETRGKV